MKIAVCTAITGNKDTLKDDQFDDGSDFICFTDNGDMESNTWTIKPACNIFSDPNRNAKIHKVLIQQYLANYDYSIWIDANINLAVSARELVEIYLAKADIALFKHYERDCLYKEADVCIRHRLDDIDTIQRQISEYREKGYPSGNGLYECTVILRRHNDFTERFNNLWWSDICRYSRRDQLSFAYALYRLNIKPNVLPGTIHKNEYFIRTPHDGYKIKTGGPTLNVTRYRFNKHPKVSIVVLVRNELDYIRKCFDSIYRHTENYELIVVDNGAGREVKDYIASLRQFNMKIITNKENKGFSYGCNQGAKVADAGYICFLNSDTIVAPKWLDKLMLAFKNNNDCGIAGPSTCFSCGGSQSIKRLESKRFEMGEKEIAEVSAGLGEGCIVYDVMGFCFVVKKELFEKVGGFDYQRFKLACTEEREWIWRAKILGDCKSYWVKDSYVHHYGHIVLDELGIDPDTYNKEARLQWERERNSVLPVFVKNNVIIPNLKSIAADPNFRPAVATPSIDDIVLPSEIFIKKIRDNDIFIVTRDGRKFSIPK